MLQEHCYWTSKYVRVASQRMTLKVALLKVGFSQGDIDNNNKHRHAVDRAKRRLSQASLPLLVNISSPGAFSALPTRTQQQQQQQQ